MDRGSSTGNTKYFENRYSIQKRKTGEMQPDTQLHQQSRRCFSLHKIQVDLVQITVEAGGFPYEALKSHRASLFSLI